MKFDPIRIGEEIVRSYAYDFIGDRHVAVRNLLSRYGDPNASLETKLGSFVRMRGPFIQALKIPKWSKMSWPDYASSIHEEFAPRGIDKVLLQVFASIGFRRLYEYQERAMTNILSDRNTLVVAGTGRGKTESWLIPLLQFIINAKRGEVPSHPANSVKALLIYPTKALAQDQFKRLIRYIFEINMHLSPKERITIGVYDGDTPSKSDFKCYGYLSNAFRYFKCPMYDSSQELCKGCDDKHAHSLIIEKEKDNKFTLQVPTEQCHSTGCPAGMRIDLDFVSLTREAIEEDKVDILLTNPDTINYRLININADTERNAFIRQPKYIILDEVHTYSGLFGSFVSMIMKRLYTVRRHMLNGKEDDLRVIAASATVFNKEELFRKITPFVEDEFDTIEEVPQNVKAITSFSSVLPSFLYKSVFDRDDILLYARHKAEEKTIPESYRSLFDALKLDPHLVTVSKDDAAIINSIREHLFERLTDSDTTPELQILRYMHQILRTQPMTTKDFLSSLKNQFDGLDDKSLENLVINFLEIGELSGMLESRTHLFSWPLDGYYACVNCGKVFDSPQHQCPNCQYHFVSKLVICKHCEQESFESWFCPHCTSLYSLEFTDKGETVYFQPLKCKCTGQENDCLRVVWRPYFNCNNCGAIARSTSLTYCNACSARTMVDDSGKKMVCTNPSCGRESEIKARTKCIKCNSDLHIMTSESLRCLSCGKGYDRAQNTNNICACGAVLHPVLYLPWVCDNEDCQRVYLTTQPPAACECGRKQLHFAGVFDVRDAYECQECKLTFARPICPNDSNHALVRGPIPSTDYRLINKTYSIEKAAKSRRAVPCYHARISYKKTSRYKPLARSPDNVAVTSAQYALRHIIGQIPNQNDLPVKLKLAKMLCFSDSHKDMERLNRDFREPEREWLWNQLIVSALATDSKTLRTLYDDVSNAIGIYQEMIFGKGGTINLIDELRKPRYRNMEKLILIQTEVDNRFLNGNYFGRWSRAKLVENGIVNVRFDIEGDSKSLDSDDIVILQTLRAKNNIDSDKLAEQVEAKLETSFNAALKSLKSKGLVLHEEGRVRLNPDRIQCRLVLKDSPILWNPATNEFIPDIAVQLGESTQGLVSFNIPYYERKSISNGTFDKTSYRISRSSALMLVGRSYLGKTEKIERRQLEYQFKNGHYPNFMSSGPAMELGIDIGDLDLLCLFGTPPNVNSYLQRIGRAGRGNRKSLIFSVSKRNPVDFHYYNNPIDLIQSDPQPVPLNEHNPEVLKISLSWAIFDYIATNFWIPWDKKESPAGGYMVTDGEEVGRITSSSTKPKTTSFTAIYASRCKELDNGNKLRVLQKVVNDNKDEVRKWLYEILNYSYCLRCEKHYVSVYTGTCREKGCNGKVVLASKEWSELVEQVISEFANHYVSLAHKFLREITLENRAISERRSVLEDAVYEDNGSLGPDKKQLIEKELSSIRGRMAEIEKLIEKTGDMEYIRFHERSKDGKYCFQIRSTSDSVDVTFHRVDYGAQKFDPIHEDRETIMAIKDYHPFGVNLYSGRRRVCCRVYPDEYKTLELSKLIAPKLVCTRCTSLYDESSNKTTCDLCGVQLRIVETIVPRAVELFEGDQILRPNIEDGGRGFMTPDKMHALAHHGIEVDRTFAVHQTEVTKFDPKRAWDIVNSEVQKIGTIEYGEISLVTSVHSYKARYTEGIEDPNPRLLEICGKCGSTVVQRGAHVCAFNENHEPSKNKFIRLSYPFNTAALRIKIEGDTAEVVRGHSLAHGLRLTLQKIGGVPIRSIGEVVEKDSTYVYDSEPGGSGVTKLFTQIGDFEHVLDLIRNHMNKSRCEDGCPECLYQFGCSKYNSPKTLSRKKLADMLSGGINIVEAKAITP